MRTAKGQYSYEQLGEFSGTYNTSVIAKNIPAANEQNDASVAVAEIDANSMNFSSLPWSCEQ